MNELRTMHLFAGVGGGLLCDLILGHKPIIAVEWDKYACRVLRARASDGWFPELSVWEGDVRLFNPSEYAGRVDCIHAGFPCQDISVAGKQAGLGEGTRSGLYREVLRIAGVVRPRYLFLENVSAILSNGLGCVLGDLAAMGYDCRWLCIRASDVGAPHGRDRWFALAELANSDSIGHLHGQPEKQPAEGRVNAQCDIAASCEDVGNTEHDGQLAAEIAGSSGAGSDDNQTGTQQAEQPARPGEQSAELADTQRDRLQGQRKDWDSEGQTGLCGGARSDEEQGVLRNADSRGWNEGAQQKPERPDWWATQSAICGMVDGISDKSHKQGWWEVEADVGRLAVGVKDRASMLKGLGNAQVPIQAAAAFTLLLRGAQHDKT